MEVTFEKLWTDDADTIQEFRANGGAPWTIYLDGDHAGYIEHCWRSPVSGWEVYLEHEDVTIPDGWGKQFYHTLGEAKRAVRSLVNPKVSRQRARRAQQLDLFGGEGR